VKDSPKAVVGRLNVMELLAREVFKGLGPRSSRAGWVPTVAQEPPELMPTFQTPHLDSGRRE
jgi:hypothetical protein